MAEAVEKTKDAAVEVAEDDTRDNPELLAYQDGFLDGRKATAREYSFAMYVMFMTFVTCMVLVLKSQRGQL